MGLVPRQHSTGGKAKLLGISNWGDTYLRTLLIHGARSAILAAQRKATNEDSWLGKLLMLRNPNGAAVALANKTSVSYGPCLRKTESIWSITLRWLPAHKAQKEFNKTGTLRRS